jgi:ankyrin repeat domain-containing protein 50
MSYCPIVLFSNYLKQERVRSIVDSLTLDQLISLLLAEDQEEYISRVPSLDYNHPMYYWIFRNIDFTQWRRTGHPQLLWLSGPPTCNIHQVSSYMQRNAASETDHIVLYFFCATATSRGSIAIRLIHTLLSQLIHLSTNDKKLLIIRNFIHSIVDQTLKGVLPDWKRWNLYQDDSPDKIVQRILEGPADHQLIALGAILVKEQRGLFLIIDGLDEVEHQRVKFIHGVRSFTKMLEQRTLPVKILLTSRPHDDIKETLGEVLCIEYDRERKGVFVFNILKLILINEECLSSLQFDNTRFNKVLKEYKGSFKWLWIHPQYKEWSIPGCSRILLIEGKPGSGKSTVAKYFNDNLLEQEPAETSPIIAKFFYSYREGELQRSHYNMLRSILYDILRQDESFFYHHFQTEYRCQRRHGEIHVDWTDESLKIVLESLGNHTQATPLYLIIDAVDESNETDRHEILNILFKLCSNRNCILKIFIASRPMGQFELRRSSLPNVIKLQDETKDDIAAYADSFLNGLNLTRLLTRAAAYIVDNAQGVFLWVKLVGEELLTYAEEGYSEVEVFEFLKQLPIELKDFYTHLFQKISKRKSNLEVSAKVFRFVLFASRPLRLDELLHALGIVDNPSSQFTLSDDLFDGCVPSEPRIISCGGNFLEVKPHRGMAPIYEQLFKSCLMCLQEIEWCK